MVIIDPSWNPADDLQAMDRAFRMGQTRDVNVYRLVAGDTIEEVSHRLVCIYRCEDGRVKPVCPCHGIARREWR